MSNISTSQKNPLIAIAKEKDATGISGSAFVKRHALVSASSVQSAILKLTKSGIITRNGQTYSITDPLFRLFIKSLYSSTQL